jgi:hypothetical protein
MMALTDTKVRSDKPEKKEYSLVGDNVVFLLIHPDGPKIIMVIPSSFWW